MFQNGGVLAQVAGAPAALAVGEDAATILEEGAAAVYRVSSYYYAAPPDLMRKC